MDTDQLTEPDPDLDHDRRAEEAAAEFYEQQHAERPDADARIPDVPTFRHVVICEPELQMLYVAPHAPGLHPAEECAAIAEAFAVFMDPPDRPSTDPIPAGRWYCSVDALGLFEFGGRCPA